eukprot:2183438-Rhodomonas_salina.1
MPPASALAPGRSLPVVGSPGLSLLVQRSHGEGGEGDAGEEREWEEGLGDGPRKVPLMQPLM